MGQTFSIEKMNGFMRQMSSESIIHWIHDHPKLINEEKLHILYLCIMSARCPLFTFELLLDSLKLSTISEFKLNQFTLAYKFPNEELDMHDIVSKLNLLLKYYKKYDEKCFTKIFINSGQEHLFKKINDTDNAEFMINLLYFILNKFGMTDLSDQYFCYNMEKYINNFLNLNKLTIINTMPDFLITKIMDTLRKDTLDNEIKVKRFRFLLPRLFVNEEIFYKLLMYLRANKARFPNYTDFVMDVRSIFDNIFHNSGNNMRFMSFMEALIKDINYKELKKIDMLLVKCYPNADYLNSRILQLHLDNNNINGIIKFMKTTKHVKWIHMKTIVEHNWNEKDLTKIYNHIDDKNLEKIKEIIVLILNISISKKYYILIKTILENFTQNNMYEEITESYQKLNTHFNVNVINLFVKHDYNFIPKIHLSEANFMEWYSTCHMIGAPGMDPNASSGTIINMPLLENICFEHQEEGVCR